MSAVDDARKAHEDLGNGPWATMAYLHALEAENKLLDEARENANAATFKAETELEKAQWAIAQWHAQWQAEEEDWVLDRKMWAETTRLLRLRLETAGAEVARLHRLCDWLAEAGSHHEDV